MEPLLDRTLAKLRTKYTFFQTQTLSESALLLYTAFTTSNPVLAQREQLMKQHFVQPTDLTVGHPLTVLTLYAIPMLISMFFQQAYNLVDSWIAGNQLGAAALGAVGTCYPVTVFFVAIASGLGLGTSLLCSQSFGAKAYAEVQSCITTSLISFIPFSVLLSAVGLLLCPYILGFLSVPVDIYDATREYLNLYILSLPFVFLYNIANGVLNGLGDSKTPLLFLMISSACNIFLDLIFVLFIPIGVAGLALATLLSQALSAMLASVTVRKMYLVFGKRMRLWSSNALRQILRLGIPSMLQHIFMSMGQLSLQTVINSYGLIVMAGYSVAFRINGIVINSLMALSNALSGFIAQNKGAEMYSRITSGMKYSLTIAASFSALVILVLLISGESMMAFFVKEGKDSADIIHAGMGFIHIVAPFYLLVCIKIIFDGALRGIGAMTCFMAATMSDVLVRICLGKTFSNCFGITGVWAIWPLAWLLGTLLSTGFYLLQSRKRMQYTTKEI